MEEKIKLGPVFVEKTAEGDYPAGFTLLRKLTSKEAFFVVKKILGLSIPLKNDAEDVDKYVKYRDGMTSDVNDWLEGKADDDDILAYDPLCMRSRFSVFQYLSLVSYLQHKKILKTRNDKIETGIGSGTSLS